MAGRSAGEMFAFVSVILQSAQFGSSISGALSTDATEMRPRELRARLNRRQKSAACPGAIVALEPRAAPQKWRHIFLTSLQPESCKSITARQNTAVSCK
jgi:hypothetical protein